MNRTLTLIGTALLTCTVNVPAAQAELVFFQTGRAMSVKAVRSDGDLLVLQLRNGGELRCDKSVLLRVEPDEIEYPDEVEQAPDEKSAVPQAPVPDGYRELIVSAAQKYGVDVRLVDAVVRVESAYDGGAVSPKGARGLMQVMPATGRQYGVLNLLDPKANLDAGVRHLKKLLARYELPLALAAYNAGEGAVDRFGGVPPFRETQNYVSRVLRLLEQG